MEQRTYFKIPETCPLCGQTTVVKGQFLYCCFESCPGQLFGTLKSWIQKRNILLWGDSLLQSLVHNNAVQGIADLYRLEPEDIAMHCSGIKVANKCYRTLHAQKDMTLDAFLSSLNIPNFGPSTASDVVQAGFDSIEKVLGMSVDDLIGVENIGSITALKIRSGLSQKKDEIADLITVINIKKPGSILKGISFCITGTTSKPRSQIEKMVIDNGGFVKSVGSGLSYLITNDLNSTSSKMTKAKKYGTKIISENDFYDMIHPTV